MLDPNAETTITMTRAEALVLFEWLHRHEDNNTTPGDGAERAALRAVSALLERALVEPFQSDYLDVLASKKAMLGPSGKVDDEE